MLNTSNKSSAIDLVSFEKIIKQLPEELQLRIIEPDPPELNLFLESVKDFRDLRINLNFLLIEHLRSGKHDLDQEQVEDLKLLYLFLDDLFLREM